MLATHRSTLLQSLSNTIADYRQNEIAPITPVHVEKWLNQFDIDDQPIILAEMDSLLKRFYFSRVRVKNCLRNFLRYDLLTPHNPQAVLPHICFLRAQKTGTSQKVLLSMIDEILHEDYGCGLAMCGVAHTPTYIYIDDGIYTGSRLRYDLTDGSEAVSWISKKAPLGCTLIVYRYYGVPMQETLFSSPQARRIVEKAFLTKGVRMVAACQYPAESMRPLGFMKLGSLGFGTFFVTYRNIANNCPLVLWWGDPRMPASHPFSQWYPLFPRRTNSQ